MTQLVQQSTLAQDVTIDGVGLHSGKPVRLRITPAPADSGIQFERTDVTGARLPARWDQVEVAPLNTRLVAADGTSVSTIEHLMAAFAGLGLSNALCQLDGPEVPIVDGSALPFVRALTQAGLVQQGAPRRAIEVLRPVRVERGDAWAQISPAQGVRMRFEIDFADAAIGQQTREMNLANGSFLRELCHSRTFCRHADVEAMHAKGLALGGSVENAVVVDGARVLTPGGLRHSDEAVRHKMLDAFGDLYTAGHQILGLYHGHKAGHAVTNMLLQALFADPQAWRMRDVTSDLWAQMPGAAIDARDLAAVA